MKHFNYATHFILKRDAIFSTCLVSTLTYYAIQYIDALRYTNNIFATSEELYCSSGLLMLLFNLMKKHLKLILFKFELFFIDGTSKTGASVLYLCLQASLKLISILNFNCAFSFGGNVYTVNIICLSFEVQSPI